MKQWHRPTRAAWIRAAAYALPLLPIVVAAAHALSMRRMPLGDDGLIVLRAADVLTSDHPWLGTWTSASLQSGVDVNNPSPLHFELLALFVKPFGIAVGGVLGAAFVSALGAVVAVRQGELLGGATGRAMAAFAATGLAWSLGTELLVEPWQPHNLLLPFLAVLLAAAGWASGRASSAAWAVGLGSVVMGAHLSFAYLVVGVCATAFVAGSLARRRRGEPWWSGYLPAVVVLAVCWIQAVVEQFASDGEGNLTRLARTLSSSAEPIGASVGTRVVGEVIAFPPWWGRPSFAKSIPSVGFDTDGVLRPGGMAPVWLAGPALVLVVVLLVIVARRARRGTDDGTRAMAIVATASLLLAWFTAVRMPVNILGLAPHQARWLWPISAVVTVCLAGEAAAAIGRWAAPRRVTVGGVRLSGAEGWLVVTGLVALWAAVPMATDLGPSASRGANDAIRSIVEQLHDTDLPGPTVFDVSTLRFAEPYSGPVIAALLGDGEPLRMADEGFVRQVGDGRRAAGDEVWAIQLRDGQAAVDIAEGEEIVAGATGPDGQPVAIVLMPWNEPVD